MSVGASTLARMKLLVMSALLMYLSDLHELSAFLSTRAPRIAPGVSRPRGGNTEPWQFTPATGGVPQRRAKILLSTSSRLVICRFSQATGGGVVDTRGAVSPAGAASCATSPPPNWPRPQPASASAPTSRSLVMAY